MGDLIEISPLPLTPKTIPLKELRKWNLFDTIGDVFLQNVRVAHVHGNHGFLVTTDDNVYKISSSISPATGSLTNGFLPSKIEALCGQSVKEFVIGSVDFAITEDGRIFAWGYSMFGELGTGTNDTSNYTPTLIKFDPSVRIVQLAVGVYHAVALTMDTREVFSWRYNKYGQLGLGNNTHQNKPCKISINLRNVRVKQISCSSYSSFALSESGDVYSWGRNLNGELGIGNRTLEFVPTKVLVDKPITKIANGKYHTLLLATSGEIYVCGANDEGQLGTGNTTSLSTPTRISADLGIFDDISSMPGINQSSARSADKIFVWGEMDKGIICSSPKQLVANLSNFPHPPTLFNEGEQIMCKSLCASDHTENAVTIQETLERAIGGVGTDVEFKVEGGLIKVHKAILTLRSAYFSRKLFHDWKQQDSPIELKDTKRDTFYALLYYLYTDKIYFSDAEIDKVLDLMKLAATYCETGLKTKCESVLQKQMELRNVFTIYAAAEKCNAQYLRQVAFNFVVANWVEISNRGELDRADLSNQDLRQFTKAWAAKYKDAPKSTQNAESNKTVNEDTNPLKISPCAEPKIKPEPTVDKKIGSKSCQVCMSDNDATGAACVRCIAKSSNIVEDLNLKGLSSSGQKLAPPSSASPIKLAPAATSQVETPLEMEKVSPFRGFNFGFNNTVASTSTSEPNETRIQYKDNSVDKKSPAILAVHPSFVFKPPSSSGSNLIESGVDKNLIEVKPSRMADTEQKIVASLENVPAPKNAPSVKPIESIASHSMPISVPASSVPESKPDGFLEALKNESAAVKTSKGKEISTVMAQPFAVGESLLGLGGNDTTDPVTTANTPTASGSSLTPKLCCFGYDGGSGGQRTVKKAIRRYR